MSVVGGRGAVHLVRLLVRGSFSPRESIVAGGRSTQVNSPEGGGVKNFRDGGTPEPARGVRAAMPRRGRARGPSAARISAVPPSRKSSRSPPRKIPRAEPARVTGASKEKEKEK